VARLTLLAPLAGWCAPLAEIPDAVFAQRMLGDGIAIDPLSNELRAPCDGEVISIAASRHAIALRSAEGAEVLMHVGIDTVGLSGEGFELRVRKGDRVRAGDALLAFDLALIARKGLSLMTPVIVTNGERFKVVSSNINRELAVGDVLLELEYSAEVASAAASAVTPVISEQVIVNHAHGIHARPAALIARHAKSLPFELQIRARGRTASARSAVAIMSLGIRGGDEMVISGFDAGAAAGIAEIAQLVRNLEAAPHSSAAPMAKAPTATLDPLRPGGVIASRGLGVGKAFYLHAAEIPVVEQGQGANLESTALATARDAVRTRLTKRIATASRTAREVIAAHLELLDDPELISVAKRAIDAGKSAGFAWRASLRTSADALEATGDSLLAERADDLLDLTRQVLLALGGQPQDARIVIPADAILVAQDLKPSQLIDIEPGQLRGIALGAGGPTSHVAILAASMGIPMLVALGSQVADIAAGTPLILDAERGTLRVAPDAAELAAMEATLAQRRARAAQQLADAKKLCHLASGERIEVFANLTGSRTDATLAVEQGAEGCGLLRTEFLFLERETAPTEQEQLDCYQQAALVLDGRPLIIRTLDIGGDKPIPYLPLPAEENPALGLRGVRTSLWRMDLFETQLRALLQVNPHGQVRILLPMITDVEEVRTVRRLLDKCATDLKVAPLPIGAMIETPAAAMLAGQIAHEVDFLSIGTNDLAQYSLAMDRGHAELAARIDGVHPAVLRLIAAVSAGANEQHKPVAVCGGLASDPAAVPLLLGLGVTELSVVPAMIPQIKSLVSSLQLDECRTLAQRAMALESSGAVRSLLAQP
jgi:phosphocarrier protein FPr/phosphocarrier protein